MNNQCFENIYLKGHVARQDFLIVVTFHLEKIRHNAERLPQSGRTVEEMVGGVTRLLQQLKCPVELRDFLLCFFQHLRLVNNL